MNKRSSGILLGTTAIGLSALVAGCGGGSSSNPVVTTTFTTTGTDIALSGTLGVLSQSTTADGAATSALGEVGFDGNGDISAATLTALNFDGETTATGTLDLAAGTYSVGSDSRSFTLSDPTLGFGTVTGEIANNGQFAAATSVDSNDDDGIVMLDVPAGNTTDASLSGTYNVAASNVGNGATVAFGNVTFDGAGNVEAGGTLSFQANGPNVAGTATLTGGNYSVNANGTFTGNITTNINSDVVTISGLLGTDGTAMILATDSVEGTCQIIVASPATVTTASDAFLSTTFDFFGLQVPQSGDDSSLGGAISLAPVGNGSGVITSGTGTAFQDGSATGQAITAITGTYNVNSNGTFSDTALAATNSGGNTNVTFPAFFLNADQSYTFGVTSAVDGDNNNVALGVIVP